MSRRGTGCIQLILYQIGRVLRAGKGRCTMSKFGLDRLLAGTAVALVFTVATPVAFAGPDTPQAVDAAVPVPDPSAVKPPTAEDMKPAPAATPAPATAATPAPAAEPKAAETKPAEAKPVDTADAVDIVTDKIREQLAAKKEKNFYKSGDRAGAETF